MRKLLIFLFIAFQTIVYSQVTPVYDGKVINATTQFISNIPVGNKILDINTGKLYLCLTATIGTATLTTASANFRDLGNYNLLSNLPTITSGTVTSISQGTWMLNSVNPLVSSGTIGVDTSKVVGFNDTLPLGKIATKKNLIDGLSLKANISDSLKRVYDSLTNIYTQGQVDGLLGAKQNVSDTSAKDATRYWVGLQGFLTAFSEADPIWIADSSDYYKKTYMNYLLSLKTDTSFHDALHKLTEKSYNSLTDKPTIPADTLKSRVYGTNPIVITGSAPAQTIAIKSDTLTDWRTKQNKGVVAYNWGNWSHATLLGYGITDAVNVADSNKTSAKNYITHKFYTDNLPSITGKVNVADSNKTSAGGYATPKWVTDKGYAPLANPAFTGTPSALTANPGTSTTQLATTEFVQVAVRSSPGKEASEYATTTALPAIVYNNGTAGVGATLTGVAMGALGIDSQSPIVGNRILVKNQVSTFQNGIYTVTATGSGIAVFVLTRALDFNQQTDILTGASTYVVGGTTLASTTWDVNSADSPVIGTDAITFVQSAGPGSVVQGNGITITGTSIAINTAITADLSSTQTLTNKTIDGVTPTVMGYVDPTSSIQTQLNAKQATLTNSAGLSTAIGGDVAVVDGGTGTSTGSITGTGALVYTAGGTNQNVTLTPSGTGYTLLSGNVGIGTTAPNSLLEILDAKDKTILTISAPLTTTNGSLMQNYSELLFKNTSITGSNSAIRSYSNAWYTSGAELAFLTSGTEKVRIQSGGNVGIGTTAPTANIHVNAANTSVLKLSNTAQGATVSDGFDLISDGVNGYVWLRENGYMQFATNNTVAMAILVNGDVGIKTTAPYYGFDVNNNIRVRGTYSYGFGGTTGAYTDRFYSPSSGIISTASQLQSTLATGTSPFAVTSTTVNTNLNADLLGGHHWADVPAAVDTTTAGTGLVNKTRMSHLSSYPTLNQNTTGTAAGLAAAYIDWTSGSGGTHILNMPTIPIQYWWQSGTYVIPLDSTKSIHSNVDIVINGLTAGHGNGNHATNTAFGVNALKFVTPGVGGGGFYNTAAGTNALDSNLTGSYNTAIGQDALMSHKSNDDNVAVGVYSLKYNINGYGNTGTGYQSLIHNIDGNYNTANGMSTLDLHVHGNGNTANGAFALFGDSTGFSNTASGIRALSGNRDGHNNIAIGDSAGYNYNLSNRMYLGARDSTTTGIFMNRATNKAWINGTLNIKTIPTRANVPTQILADSAGMIVKYPYSAGGGRDSTFIKSRNGILVDSTGNTYGIKLDTTIAETKVLAASQLALKAPLASPSFTGTVTTDGDNVLQSNTASHPYINMINGANGNSSGYFNFYKSRGSLTSPTDVQAGDYLANIYFQGYANSGWRFPSYMRVQSTGISGSNIGTRIYFQTSNTSGIGFITYFNDDGSVTLPGTILTLPTYTTTVGATNKPLFIDNTGLIGTQTPYTINDSITLWHGMHKYQSDVFLGDDQIITLPGGIWGNGTISANYGDTFASFHFNCASIVTLHSISTSDVASTDTDGKLCVYSGGSGYVKIKNRLGFATYLLIDINYSVDYCY